MSRLTIAILLLFSSVAVIVQGVLAYELNMVQTLIAEEEPHDDKPSDKNGKNDTKAKYFSSYSLHAHLVSDQLHSSTYMPPEAI
jgi:hypothetical protein